MVPISRNNLKDISYIMYILVAIFAISSWIDISGIRIEVPLMINVLPEGWNLMSYIALITQSANIGPVLYLIISKVLLKRNITKTTNFNERIDIIMSFSIISVEIVSLTLLSFFWNYTTTIAKKECSFALFSLIGCIGLCSCLSSLVYLPYMARYPSYYISAYYFGYGFCNLVPGLIGLLQGVGEEPTCVNVTVFANSSCLSNNFSDASLEYKLVPQYPPPRFSVQAYFLIICGILFMSMISFYCLNYTKLRRHQVHVQHNLNTIEGNDMLTDLSRTNEVSETVQTPENQIFSKTKLIFYLVILCVEYFVLFGFLPPILPFVCLPYGHVVFNVTVRISNICIGLVSVLVLFLPRPSDKTNITIFFIGLTFYFYLFGLALQSPHPILQYKTVGSFLVVISSMITHTCLGYCRIILTILLHTHGGRRALMWCGGIMQVGSFAGAVISFILINWTEMFVSSLPCN